MSNTIKQKRTIDGKDYTLVFDFQTLCDAEEATGQSMMRIGDNLNMGTISGMFWASLQDRHKMTRRESNALVDKAGGFDTVAEWVTDGLASYLNGVSKPAPKVKTTKKAKAA